MRAAAMICGVLLACAGCASKPAEQAAAPEKARELTDIQLSHVPAFARMPYDPFTRADVVALALGEWRAFGSPVDDDPPDTRPPLPADQKPERMPGLWQRVGVYWWLGQDANRGESAWTGKHDDVGTEFAGARDGEYAWSAAFISYLLRIGGAGARFPYSPSHFTYINAAARQAKGRETGWVVVAERPRAYAVQPGDLICAGRDSARHMTFDRLPDGAFPAHCDIVVDIAPGMLSVVGGNVDDAVTMKHVPITPDGKLAEPDGHVLDTRYPWFVVLRVLYDR